MQKESRGPWAEENRLGVEETEAAGNLYEGSSKEELHRDSSHIHIGGAWVYCGLGHTLIHGNPHKARQKTWGAVNTANPIGSYRAGRHLSS